MTKKLIFCLLIHNATHAMQPAEPITGAEMVMAQLLDTKNTEADVMRFLESFEDFNAQIDVNELLHVPINKSAMLTLHIFTPDASWVTQPIEASSLLHAACKRKFRTVIKFLLDRNADINIHDSDGFTPLGFTILSEQDIAITCTLLDYGANQQCIYEGPEGPYHAILSALAIATFRGYTEIIALLLARGADPNELSNGKPALMYTASEWPQNDRYKCAHLLIKAGANPSWQDKWGDSVLGALTRCHHAYPGSQDVFQRILQTRDKSRNQVLAERAHEMGDAAAVQQLETTINLSTRRALISKLKHSRHILLNLKTNNAAIGPFALALIEPDGTTPLVDALYMGCVAHTVEIVKCLTYREIVDAITDTKRYRCYDILLKALTAPENYESVLQEARDDHNQELIDDLKKIRTP